MEGGVMQSGIILWDNEWNISSPLSLKPTFLVYQLKVPHLVPSMNTWEENWFEFKYSNFKKKLQNFKFFILQKWGREIYLIMYLPLLYTLVFLWLINFSTTSKNFTNTHTITSLTAFLTASDSSTASPYPQDMHCRPALRNERESCCSDGDWWWWWSGTVAWEDREPETQNTLRERSGMTYYHIRWMYEFYWFK